MGTRVIFNGEGILSSETKDNGKPREHDLYSDLKVPELFLSPAGFALHDWILLICPIVPEQDGGDLEAEVITNIFRNYYLAALAEFANWHDCTLPV